MSPGRRESRAAARSGGGWPASVAKLAKHAFELELKSDEGKINHRTLLLAAGLAAVFFIFDRGFEMNFKGGEFSLVSGQGDFDLLQFVLFFFFFGLVCMGAVTFIDHFKVPADK